MTTNVRKLQFAGMKSPIHAYLANGLIKKLGKTRDQVCEDMDYFAELVKAETFYSYEEEHSILYWLEDLKSVMIHGGAGAGIFLHNLDCIQLSMSHILSYLVDKDLCENYRDTIIEVLLEAQAEIKGISVEEMQAVLIGERDANSKAQ